MVKKAYELNVEPVQITETYHKGSLPQKFESIRVSQDNVIASVFKKSEDGVGYILRCYEACGRETDVSIELPLLDRKLNASFGRCEIKTFFIPSDPHEPVAEKNLIEM